MEQNSSSDNLPEQTTSTVDSSADGLSPRPQVQSPRSRLVRRLIPYMPLIITIVLFLAVVLMTHFGCASLPEEDKGECALGWMWFLWAPMFALMFVGSLLFLLVAGIVSMIRARNKQ